MNINYTVPKRKYNRMCYRITGIIFVCVAAFAIYAGFKAPNQHIRLTMILASFLGVYGIFLIKTSLRKLAFDIKYNFNDDGITVYHHYGESVYTWDDIEFCTMIIADETGICYMLNIKAGKSLYIIPFTFKKELCEQLYEHVHAHIKKDEDDE